MTLSVNANPEATFDPARASIDQLSIALDSGKLSSRQLVTYYLDRIDRFDKRGPHINSLISLNSNALEQAADLDLHRKTVQHRSKLYGIPFIAKDNYNSVDMTTTGGSAALRLSRPLENAAVVQRLLSQGAILVGKANMSELAASYDRLGYSSAGGLTLNPYDLDRNVSGSSSGSAAAVAADFATFAIGTDTSGSVRGPGSVAGLVALRPTFGLVSRHGVIPLSMTFDTAGVLARTVKDVVIVLDAIVGPDPQDTATLQQPKPIRTYLEDPGIKPLRGARLGVITNFRFGNSEVDAAEQKVLTHLQGQGAVLIDIELPKQFEKLWDSVLGPAGEAEFKPQFERYLRSLPPSQPKTLAQFIDASTSSAVADSATPMNPGLLEALRTAEVTPLTDSPTYIHILSELIPSLRKTLETLIGANNLSALVFSTMSCPASPRFDRADPHYVCNRKDPYEAGYIASAVGFPEITVPTARVSGNLPAGFSLMGLPYGEAKLLALANALQTSLPAMPPPESVAH